MNLGVRAGVIRTSVMRAGVCVVMCITTAATAQSYAAAQREANEYLGKCGMPPLLQTISKLTTELTVPRWTGECVNGKRHGTGALDTKSLTKIDTGDMWMAMTVEGTFVDGVRVGLWCTTKSESNMGLPPAGACQVTTPGATIPPTFLKLADGRWQPVQLKMDFADGAKSTSSWVPIQGESPLPAGSLEAQGQAAVDVALGKKPASAAVVTELAGMEDLMPGRKIQINLSRALAPANGKPTGFVISTRTLEAVERIERERMLLLQQTSSPRYKQSGRQAYEQKGSLNGFGSQLLKIARASAGDLEVIPDLAAMKDKGLSRVILLDADIFVRHDLLQTFQTLPQFEIATTPGRSESVCGVQLIFYVIESDLTIVRKVVLPGNRFGRSKPWGIKSEPSEEYFQTLDLCASLIWSGALERPPISMLLIQEQLQNALR